jgi:hypothetical protein
MFSHHAKHRNQQRCIPPAVHDWLTRYGTEHFDGRGGCRVFFSKTSIKKMEQELGKHFVRENKKYLDAYRVPLWRVLLTGLSSPAVESSRDSKAED